MKKELLAGTTDEQRTKADSIPSASVEANPMLSAALSIEDSNILIAKFMGYAVKDFDAASKRYTFSDNEDAPYYDWFLCRDLEYNSSWDWLMPVVEKIISIEGVNLITKNWLVTIDVMLSNTKSWQVSSMDYIKRGDANFIGNYYFCVIEFIKWYNDNTAAVGSR